VTVTDTLSSSVKVVSHTGVAEAERVASHWLVQHRALVRAKPDGRPQLLNEPSCLYYVSIH